MVEQYLKERGYTDENIGKIMAVLNDKDAYQYALSTGDVQGAYDKLMNKEKPEVHNLNDWFSSFSKEVPEDAKSLSIALTKFARFVQSELDKNKASQ